MYPMIFFHPVIKNLVWGSEHWTISAHAHGDAQIKAGPHAGTPLSRLWDENPALFGRGATPGKHPFPLLVKIIDAKTDLSIQVHPDDTYAAAHENGSLGKTECWYILDAAPGSFLVLGHDTRDKKELREAIETGRFMERAHKVHVGRGDFIQIEPGSVHAIGGGIRLLEIQQASDITYRLYDYGRLENGKPRPLHLDKALDVITFPAWDISQMITPAAPRPANAMHKLIDCAYYRVWELPVCDAVQIKQDYAFMIVCVVEGQGSVCGRPIASGDHFILSQDFGAADFRGNMRLIIAA